MQENRCILLNCLWHNKHIANNDVEMLFYIYCSNSERAQRIYDLMTRVQPYTVGDRPGVPDEMVEEMNRCEIRNLWKFARLLDDDHALLSVELTSSPPEPDGYEFDSLNPKHLDLVVRHSQVYYGGD